LASVAGLIGFPGLGSYGRIQTCDQWSDQKCRSGIFETGNSRKFDLSWGN
jgi:hypothetical protein